MKTQTGLKDLILSAASEEEVNSLVAEGRSFTHASPRTRNRWKIAARKRVLQLNKLNFANQ
jgi:hypothetical protein